MLHSLGSPLTSNRLYMSHSPPPPLQGVIDGDLCEVFSRLPLAKQKQLADDLDRTPYDILKKLEDVRNRIC